MARNVRASGRWRRGDACSGDRGGPGLAPRTKFLTVGEAHQVAVPRGLEVQVPEPDFEPSGEGFRAAHGVARAAVLGANHHRGSQCQVDLRRSMPHGGRQLSVRNVILTLTSSKRHVLSLDGRC
jgi:hypothetical protein